MNESADPVRQHLMRVLNWEEAHVGFDKAVDGVAEGLRGAGVAGFDHTLWQLLEHIRIAQKDLLDFCVNRQYVHALKWPEDYWPHTAAPASSASWDASIADVKADRETLTRLIQDPEVDLLAVVPTGEGPQTYLRAILLVADHNAYHVGQLVALRQMLGNWP